MVIKVTTFVHDPDTAAVVVIPHFDLTILTARDQLPSCVIQCDGSYGFSIVCIAKLEHLHSSVNVPHFDHLIHIQCG